MKVIRWVVIVFLAAGCVLAKRSNARLSESELAARLRDRALPADELGITLIQREGGKSIRWKEAISPRQPVTLPMLPPAARRTARPRIPLRINEGPLLPVVIDTGAELNVFDAAVALDHGVKVADPDTFGNLFQGIGGTEFAYYGMFRRVRSANFQVQNLFTVLRVAPGGGSSIDNVLGLATLGKFSYVTLDFLRRRVTFSLDEDYAPGRFLIAEAPLSVHGLQVAIEPRVNETFAVNLLLDTGNDAEVMLTERLIDALGLREASRNGRKSVFAGVGGTIETRTFPLRSFALGGRTFAAVDATAVPDHFVPCLGSGFLQRFKATVDFKKQKLWLEN